MLRRRTFLVAACLVCSVLVLPVLNVASRLQAATPRPWTIASLFDIRFEAAGWMSHVLYGWGISSAPEKVVVGRQGWLYLGDAFTATVSASRRGQSAADIASAERIVAATRAWDAWLRERGVKDFRVVVGPNKASVYPEYLPRWALPAHPAPVDALFARAAPWFVDVRPALLRAKAETAAPLYYTTDTHWTYPGGSVAFETLALALAQRSKDLRWPGADLLALRDVVPRQGGDLARLLQLQHDLADTEPHTGASSARLETIHHAAGCDKVLRRGGSAEPDAPLDPTRVVSPGALNARKVLWLRDSFGGALAPLMAATFSETLHVRWDTALRDGQLAQLVESWRPDYVLVTVVERDALSPLLATLPPDAPGASQGLRNCP